MTETATQNLPGRLVLVVGPSGAGKDMLIDGARQALRDDPQFVFPRREITRPPGGAGEDYISVSEATFNARRESGTYAFAWHAHGLNYGIGRAIEAALGDGKTVIVNVSRSLLPMLRQRYPRHQIVALTVPRAILRDRLRARGRESDAEIEERLNRAAAFTVEGKDVIKLTNDSAKLTLIVKFIEILRST